jgi:hypothetical protein
MEWWSNARPKLQPSAIQLLHSSAYVRAAYCGSRNRVNAIVAITSPDFPDSVNRSLIHRQSKVHEQSRHRPDQIVD